jgi:hypothetical protein
MGTLRHHLEVWEAELAHLHYERMVMGHQRLQEEEAEAEMVYRLVSGEEEILCPRTQGVLGGEEAAAGDGEGLLGATWRTANTLRRPH